MFRNVQYFEKYFLRGTIFGNKGLDIIIHDRGFYRSHDCISKRLFNTSWKTLTPRPSSFKQTVSNNGLDDFSEIFSIICLAYILRSGSSRLPSIVFI